MTYNTYLQTAQTIFDSFPNDQVWLQGGFTPNRQLQKPEAGYCVVLRYDEKITNIISDFMVKVHTVLPFLVEYNELSLHTTIGTYAKSDLKEFVPDPAVLLRLSASVQKGINSCSQNLFVEFGKWLYNNETILVSAYPNQELWEICLSIGNAFQDNGLSLEMGRILHITTARFTRNASYQTFEKFSSLMKSAPALGVVHPIAIDLATWSCDGMTFNLDPHKHFVL